MILSDLQYDIIALFLLMIALAGALLLFFSKEDRKRDFGLIILLLGLAMFVAFMKLVP